MAFRMYESLDTNILVRVVIKDIPEQCLKIQDLLMRPEVIYHVSDLAITEMVYVLQNEGLSRVKIVEGIKIIFELPRIRVNFALFEKVLPMYLEHPKLSFNDCCLAVYAELNEAEPLWTFDRKLAAQVATAKMVE